MSSVIENAVKGQQNAMKALFADNRQKVYDVLCGLCGDQTFAAEATAQVFETVWDGILSHAVRDEKEFTHLALRMAADLARAKITKTRSKAFQQPNDRNFVIKADIIRDEDTPVPADKVPALLPDLQRFILILHTAGDFTNEQLASFFRFDGKTVSLALEAEKTNLSRLTDTDGTEAYEAVCRALQQDGRNGTVPQSVTERAERAIALAAKPFEKKRTIRFIRIAGIVVACCGLVAGAATYFIKNAGKPEKTTSTVSSTVSSNVSTNSTASTAQTGYLTEPVIELDENATYYADIELKNYGTVTVKLDQKSAPVTVANFVNLAQNKFYDGLTFHRIMEGFMMQGGDPTGTGTGGSDKDIVGEFAKNGDDNALKHTRGAISMARSTDYNSASSQFFIMQQDNTSLDGLYAAFGYVTKGMEIVDAVCTDAKPTDSNGTIPAASQPVINSVTIRTE